MNATCRQCAAFLETIEMTCPTCKNAGPHRPFSAGGIDVVLVGLR